MRLAAMVTAFCVGGLATSAADAAQQGPMPFEQAVYLSCKEADAMPAAQRVLLVRQLAEHSGRHHGVHFPDDDNVVGNDKVDQELASMIRAGCTMFPNASVFFIVDAAVKAEAAALRAAKK